MKGTYRVRKSNLNPLHREAKNIANQFQCFTINYQAELKRMSSDIVSKETSTTIWGIQEDSLLMSTPTKICYGSQYLYPMCGCILIMIVVISLMSWFYYGFH